MGIVLWIVFGALAGWIASLIMGTDNRQGAFLNIALGVVGALIGGLIFNFFGQAGVTGFNIYSLLVSIIGAVSVTWVYSIIARRA